VKGKKLRISIITFVGLMALVYSACNNPDKMSGTNTISNPAIEQKVSLIKLLVGNGNNLFRSVDLGEDLKTVLNSEKKIPDENDTDDISYTFPIDTLMPDSVNETIDSVNYFKITYYFDKEKLNEVDEEVYLESDSIAAVVLERFTNYMTAKYGDYASQNDSRVWGISHKGKKKWVTLSDKSEEYDNGKLLLVFYSEDI
jgi:hypothetical protein